jgi:hypothetical protein
MAINDVLRKYSLLEVAAETAVAGQKYDCSLPPMLTRPMISSVYIRNCYIICYISCLRKQKNGSDAITLLKCKSAVL